MTPVSDFSAKTLFATVSQLKELRSLDATGRTLEGPVDWKTLGTLPHLESLRIAWSGLDDSRLAGIEHLQHLKTLDVSHSEITGQSLESIAKLPELETLNLMETGVAHNILALSALPKLRIVNFPRDPFRKNPLSNAELAFFLQCCSWGDVAAVRDPEAASLAWMNKSVSGGITSSQGRKRWDCLFRTGRPRVRYRLRGRLLLQLYGHRAAQGDHSPGGPDYDPRRQTRSESRVSSVSGSNG